MERGALGVRGVLYYDNDNNDKDKNNDNNNDDVEEKINKSLDMEREHELIKQINYSNDLC